MRFTQPGPTFLALLLALSIPTLGCGRGTEEAEQDQVSIEQEQEDARIAETRDPEIPTRRIEVIEPETGDETGADPALDERERRLAERQAELDAREQRLRDQEATRNRPARAPQPAPPAPRTEPPARKPAEPEEPEVAEVDDDVEVADPREAEREREERVIREEREAREAEEERAAEPEAPRAPAVARVPAGTVLEAQFLEGISSESSEAGDIFRARIAEDVATDGGVAIPAGSEVVGVVTEAVPTRKVGGRAKLSVKFTDLVLPSGGTVPIQASFIEEGRSQTGKDAATIGGAAAGGAVLGRILNRKDRSKGAVIGAIIGAVAGTAIASRTPGEEVAIPEGTVIHLKLDDEVEVRRR